MTPHTTIASLARRARRSPFFTAANVAGLAVSYACFMLVVLFARDELSYDRHHPDHARVVRVTQVSDYGGVVERSASVPFPVRDALLADHPELAVAGARIFNYQSPAQYVVTDSGSRFDAGVYYVDPDFFRIFDHRVVAGRRDSLLACPGRAVLTESGRRLHFGGAPAVGREIVLNDRHRLVVEAVVADPDPHSHLRYTMLASMATIGAEPGGIPDTWVWNPCWIYIKLAPGATPADLEARLPAFAARHFGDAARKSNALHAQPLSDIHLRSRLSYELGRNRALSEVNIFAGLALFVLLMAMVNYTNLSTADAVDRQRETAVLKVSGGSRWCVARGVLAESVAVSLFAMALALCAAEIGAPWFNRLLGGNVRFAAMSRPSNIALAAGVAVVSGLLCGLYPAWLHSRTPITATLKGNFAPRAIRSVVRKVLVVILFSISLTLILGTQIINGQLRLLLGFDLGFRYDDVALVAVNTRHAKENLARLAADARSVEGVESVVAMHDVIGVSHNTRGFKPQGRESAPWQYFPALVAHGDFARTFDVEVVSERADTAAPGILLSQSMARHLGWTDAEAVGRSLRTRRGDEPIVGVVRDFRIRSLHKPGQPFFVSLRPYDRSDIMYAKFLAIRFRPGAGGKVMEQVERLWRAGDTRAPFAWTLLSDEIEKQYSFERRLNRISIALTWLSVVLAVSGVVGLGAFLTSRRKREVAIRLALGARPRHVFWLLAKEYAVLMLVALPLSAGSAALFGKLWLGSFAESLSGLPLIFAATAVASLAVAVLPVLAHTLWHMSVPPSRGIRAE